jgi:hypothetical protein
MKTIKRKELSNVTGGQQANQAALMAQGQAVTNFNNCVGAATSKANTATASVFGQVKSGGLTPTQGVTQAVAAGRTEQSEIAACGAKFPIPQ